MRRRTGYNPNRHMASNDRHSVADRESLAARICYGGNPEYKRNPLDYGLSPPASPRPGKFLCDGGRPIAKAEALSLLASGVLRGLVSQRIVDGFPQNIWSVSDIGELFEAQLENSALGMYHGYPMPHD